LTTTDAIDVESIAVAIEPKPLGWARYVVGDDGAFAERGACWARDGEAAVIAVAGLPDEPVPVTYDSATARTAAAHLLGYAHQLDLDEPLPEHVLTTLLAPDTRTATGTTWDLGSGLVLRHTVPFGTSLTAEAVEWTLTAELATRWARALLTVAAELDHAHAVAAQAILAERTGKTPTENVRAWLTDLHHELTADQKRLAERVRGVLADEERIARGETLVAALDVAHPDLTTSLADVRLLSRETITHLDAADVIEQLAARYALPIYLWTAASWYVRDEIGGGTLTEQEWLRVGRTVEMGTFGSVIENEQGNNGAAIDVRLALYQAGVLCRECDARITGDIATTLGRCDECRPADPDDAMAEALAAGCPGAPNVSENFVSHFLSSSGPCTHCGLPLPEYYHLVLEAEHTEHEQRQAAYWAVENKKHRVMQEARRLLVESMAQDGDDDSAEAKERRLVIAREAVRQLREWELESHYTSYVLKATRNIELSDLVTESAC
jgi:hypothetical protein